MSRLREPGLVTGTTSCQITTHQMLGFDEITSFARPSAERNHGRAIRLPAALKNAWPGSDLRHNTERRNASSSAAVSSTTPERSDSAAEGDLVVDRFRISATHSGSAPANGDRAML